MRPHSSWLGAQGIGSPASVAVPYVDPVALIIPVGRLVDRFQGRNRTCKPAPLRPFLYVFCVDADLICISAGVVTPLCKDRNPFDGARNQFESFTVLLVVGDNRLLD